MTAAVLVEHDDHLAHIVLNRPEVLNAIDNRLAEDLIGACETVADDDSTWAVILRGAGERAFCAGADLKGIGTDRSNRVEPDGPGPMGPTRMRLRKPVVAAIEGYAVAGGLELACWADLRVAAEDAVLGVFCRRWGVPLVDGGTVRLPRLVGPAKALEMNTTGEAISAEEGYEYGLVNRVVADHELFDTAMAWARKFARQAPLALEQIKQVSHKGDLDEGIAAEKQGFATAFGSEDAKEGIGAFIGKRKAKFKGK